MIFRTHTLRYLCLVGLMALPLSACDLTQNQLKTDRASNMEFQDYRDALASRVPDVHDDVAATDPGIPALQPYVANPSDKLKAMPLVSISVNQTVPLRDALFELAEQAQYDVELDPRIRGSVIFTARNKPFDIVIDRLADVAGLRYKFEDDILRIELDTPYHEVYKISYLSYIRSNNSSINNNVAVVSGEGADTGSSFSSTATSEADFWGELEANLTQILGAEAASETLRTGRDPRITATSDNPAPVEPLMIDDNGEITVPNSQTPPPAVLRVDSLPTDDLGEEEEAAEFNTQFSLNRQAGMISVFASERMHKKIVSYLELLKKSVTSQVLIEAKVLEVGLTDEFAAGINWQTLAGLSNEFSFGLAALGRPALNPGTAPTTNAFLSYTGNDLSAAVDAISRFGTVNALASPRLTVLNNQSAVLNVADNRVYFDIDVTTTISETGVPNTEVDSEIRNVPEGVLISVIPSIDLQTQEIAMAIRPTITKIVDQVPDPAALFNGITSNVPVVNVQEVDTVISVGSGQTVIIGGLMEDRSETTQNAVPVLGEMPLFGAAFRNSTDKIEKTELVVFLRATIVNSGGSIHDTDKDLYKTFSNDRRPLRF